jgi:hypothetical protein
MQKVQAINKLTKTMSKLIKIALTAKFNQAAGQVQQSIIDEYDQELVDVVTDRNSKTNPNLYRDEFIERLGEFDYVEISEDTISLISPDMETFDFSGRLKVIQAIMHGMAGIYIEINEEDYINVFGKRPVNQDPVDEYVPPKEKIYIARYNAKIKTAERELNKKFVRYPFSNTAPFNILDEGDKYIEENMGRWIDEALDEAQKTFAMNYKGARL